ncbi:protein dehydratase [Baekduia soli]|uniref:Protein dehydratase n=1 Tax=Baekduia soli TaxID=496014 RepID=A0A5B8UBG7_9ACTN|nr:MaoC/PaaZ C-terminal domain-containing protein [Baekduia soli]QEC50523.1 protein dehydratase [Baekduia soli]
MSAGPQGGAPLPERVVDPVDADAMRGLAELLRDPNPIHLDGAAAAAAGLGDRPVNQGPANCAYVVAMLQEAFPGAELRRLRFRLLSPVAAGDRVVAGGVVTGVEHDGGAMVVSCETWLDVDGGRRVVSGSAEVLIVGPGPAAA